MHAVGHDNPVCSTARAYFAATCRGCSNSDRGSLAGSKATSIHPLIISSQVCSPYVTVAAGFGLKGLFRELS